MSDLPNIADLKHLLDRLHANDISWFRDRYRAGDLEWLSDRLPEGEYEELGRRIEAGDLDWLRSRIGTLDWSAVPGAGELLKGVGPLAAVRATLGADGKGALGGATGAGRAAVGAVAGASAAGATALKGGGDGTDGRRRKGLLALIPLLVIAGLIALALNKCGNDDDENSGGSSETTVVAAVDLAPADTAPVDTTPVDTAPVDTAPAETAPVAPDATPAVDPNAPTGDIAAIAGSAGPFSTLTTAIGAAGLTETLKGAGPFTVFAPTDDAFAALPTGALDALLANKEALAKVLTYHVVPGSLKAADLVAGPVKTVEGDDLKVSVDGGTLKVNDATVTSSDTAATNGVIHAIDRVLLPPGFDLNALLAGTATTTVAAPGDTTAATPATTNAAGDLTPENLTVYFASGSAALDADATAKITGAVEVLKTLADGTKVNLVGHADRRGNAAANQKLSEQRAANVEAALQAGLPGKVIGFTTSAKGDTDPVADLGKSRRVTIEIVK